MIDASVVEHPGRPGLMRVAVFGRGPLPYGHEYVALAPTSKAFLLTHSLFIGRWSSEIYSGKSLEGGPEMSVPSVIPLQVALVVPSIQLDLLLFLIRLLIAHAATLLRCSGSHGKDARDPGYVGASSIPARSLAAIFGAEGKAPPCLTRTCGRPSALGLTGGSLDTTHVCLPVHLRRRQWTEKRASLRR